MSCYEFETGTIKLPTGYASKLRAALTREADAHIDTLLRESTEVYSKVQHLSPASRLKALVSMPNISEQVHSTLVQWRVNPKTGKHTAKVVKPSKASITRSLVGRVADHWEPTGPKRLTFHVNGGTITFTGTNTVEWNVPEGNHAVEYARSHPVAQEFFRFLDTVEWTSRSGGTIVGNNEYNREDLSIGGGGNFEVRTYSRADMLARRAASRSRRYY